MFDSRESLYAQPMIPYILGTAFGVFLSSIGAAFGDFGAGRVLMLTGGFIGLAMFVLGFVELLDWRDVNEHRKENMRLHNQLLARDSVWDTPKKQPVQIHVTTPTPGGSQTKVHEYEPEQIPPEDFIRWMFLGANQRGVIPADRPTFKKWTAAANVWHETLEGQGLIEPIGEYDNAPRRIVDGITLDDVLARFGHAPLLQVAEQ